MDDSKRVVWTGPRKEEEKNYLIRKGLLVEDGDGDFRELSTVIYESSEDDSFQDRSYQIPFVGVENIGEEDNQSIDVFDDKENVQPSVKSISKQVEKQIRFLESEENINNGDINSSGIGAAGCGVVSEKQDTKIMAHDVRIEISQPKEVCVKESNASFNVTIGTERLFSQEPGEMKVHSTLNITAGSTGFEVMSSQDVCEKEDYIMNVTTGIERLYSDDATDEKHTPSVNATVRFETVISQDVREEEDNPNFNVTTGSEILFTQDAEEWKRYANSYVTTGFETTNSLDVSEVKDCNSLNFTTGIGNLYAEDAIEENDNNVLNTTTGFEIVVSQDDDNEVDYTGLNVITGAESSFSQEPVEMKEHSNLDITTGNEEDEFKLEKSGSEVNNRSFTITTHEDDSYGSSLLENTCSTGGMDDTMSAIEKILALAEEAEALEHINVIPCSQTPESRTPVNHKENTSVGSAQKFQTPQRPQPKVIKSAQKKDRTFDTPNISSFFKTPEPHYSSTANKGSVSASSVKSTRTPNTRETKSSRKTLGEPKIMTASPNLLSLSAKTPEFFFASQKNGSLSVYSVKKLQTLKSRDVTPIRGGELSGESPLISVKTPESFSAKAKKGSSATSSIKRIQILGTREVTPSGKDRDESPNLMSLSAATPELLLFTNEKKENATKQLQTPNSREANSSTKSSDNLINFSPCKPKRVLDLKKKGKLFSPSPPRPPPSASKPRIIQKLVEQQNDVPDAAGLCKNLFQQTNKETSPSEKVSSQNKMYADINSPVREYIYGRATPSIFLKSKNRNVTDVKGPLKKDEGLFKTRIPQARSSFMASTPINCLGAANSNTKRSMSAGKRMSVHSKENIATQIPKLATGANRFKTTEFKGSSKQRIETQDPKLLTNESNEMALRHTGLRNESGNESLLTATPLKKQFIPSRMATLV